jgi:DNA repair exonuclease SbcCD ATPase subunit
MYRHPTADTNVLAVRNEGTDLFFDFDESETDSQLKDARQERDDLQKELEELTTKFHEQADELSENRNLLDEVKDDGDTLRGYRDRAEHAEKMAREWGAKMNVAECELASLRKRKGIDSNVVRHAHEITRFINYLTQAKPCDFSRYQKEAAELVKKLYAP